MKVNEFNEKKIYSEASGSCAVVDDNIEMILNDLGMYEEKVNANLDYELSPLVELVSPNLNSQMNETFIANKLYGNIEGIQFDERIGYYKSLYIGHVREGDYRENGSSGGMGTWIFKELFEKDMIDGVIHVKENEDPNSPLLFQYDISESIEEIKAGSKTKYYPVEFSKVLKTVKEVPGRYAIVGIPSFIMAIRLLSENDAIIKDRIKFTVGLICGHQKSSKVAEAFGWQVGIKPGNLRYIDFRKKLPGKSASHYGVNISGLVGSEQKSITKPIYELIGDNWGEGYFKVKASDFTDDVMNETADITLGDAWLPDYTTDSMGNNVVIIRDPQINLIVKEGIKNGKLKMDVVDKDLILKSQSAHYRHTHDELAYRLYKKDKKNEWRPQKRVIASNNISYWRRKVQDLREDISNQSHIIYKKAVDLDDFSYFQNEIGKLSRKYKRVYLYMSIKDMNMRRIGQAITRRTKKILKLETSNS